MINYKEAKELLKSKVVATVKGVSFSSDVYPDSNDIEFFARCGKEYGLEKVINDNDYTSYLITKEDYDKIEKYECEEHFTILPLNDKDDAWETFIDCMHDDEQDLNDKIVVLIDILKNNNKKFTNELISAEKQFSIKVIENEENSKIQKIEFNIQLGYDEGFELDGDVKFEFENGIERIYMPWDFENKTFYEEDDCDSIIATIFGINKLNLSLKMYDTGKVAFKDLITVFIDEDIKYLSETNPEIIVNEDFNDTFEAFKELCDEDYGVSFWTF